MIKNLNILNYRGLQLSAILSTQDNGQKYPVIILLQGFLGKKDGEKLNSLSTYLLKLGFATARFDYPGYGQSEGEINKEYLVSHIIDNIGCVLNFLKTQPGLNNSKVGIWGQSMGGMLSIITASLHPDIRAVCAVSPPIQITRGDDLEKISAGWKARGFIERKNSGGELIKIPYDFVKDSRKWNAAEFIKDVQVPVLIILGKKDDVVPPGITRELFQAANEPKELMELDDMPHDYKEQVNFMDMINKISGEFFLKHLLI